MNRGKFRVIIVDPPRTVGTLNRLSDMGVALAIDDFGTGYSSLAYLRQFPVDIIKIDKSFVAGAGDGPDASALARAIVQLGRTLRLSTIAEGIETAGQLAELAAAGCEYGQGYYFAQPVPAEELMPLLDLRSPHTDLIPAVPAR